MGAHTRLAALLLAALVPLGSCHARNPSAWFMSEQYVPGASTGCGTSGPVGQWNVDAFGLCVLSSGTYMVKSVDPASLIVSVQSYGTDSTCSKGHEVGAPMTQSIPANQLGCQSVFQGVAFESFGAILPAAYSASAAAAYGLPKAPFTGVGALTTQSSTCSDYSQILSISLANAQTVSFCYSAETLGLSAAPSFTVSCANPGSPTWILYPTSADCTGLSTPMTAANAASAGVVYADLLNRLSNPPCQENRGAYFQELFCVDTAVSTDDRLNFPTPLPSRPPTPSAQPTIAPSAAPSQTPAPTQTVLLSDTQALCSVFYTFDTAQRTKLLPSWTCPAAATSLPVSGQTACNPNLGAPYSTWAGVTCQLVHFCDGATCDLNNKWRVVSLNLAGKTALGGQLTDSIGALNGLTSLDVSGISLTGGLPSQLGSLIELTSLTADSNALSGKLPTALGALVNLKKLSLANNKLSGELPPQLASCSALATINVASNVLGPRLPSWSSMASLASVNLADNNFAGSWPATLCSLPASSTLAINLNPKLQCIPICLSQQTATGHDASQVYCSPPTTKPTNSPVPAPSAPPRGSADVSSSGNDSGSSSTGSTLSTGGVVGVSLALVVLFVAAVLVYRAVRNSEVDLPSDDTDETKFVYAEQGNPLTALGGGYSADPPKPPTVLGAFFGGTKASSGHDMIPPPLSTSGGAGGGRRDSIPMAVDVEASGKQGKSRRIGHENF